MKLYHSSTCSVESPDTIHSRDYLDFGKGFPNGTESSKDGSDNHEHLRIV